MNEKEQIIEKLKKNGCRITRQRKLLIDIILENSCSSCKEIYFRASEEGGSVGLATVYRMVNALEDIGAIDRSNIYRLEHPAEGCCAVFLDDGTVCRLSEKNWKRVILEGMEQCGYLKNRKIRKIVMEDGRKQPR